MFPCSVDFVPCAGELFPCPVVREYPSQAIDKGCIFYTTLRWFPCIFPSIRDFGGFYEVPRTVLSGSRAKIIGYRLGNRANPILDAALAAAPESRLGAALFLRAGRQIVATRAGIDLLADVRPALDRLAATAARVREGAAAGRLPHVSALPTFAMRWLIARLPEFQRGHPGLELQIVTASTSPEQFRADVDDRN
jgi:hypothetical protein